MKEITLKEILEMSPREIVDFLTHLDMQERMDFYHSLLDRHKELLAERIETVMGAVKFSDIAAQYHLSEDTPAAELEPLAKEGNAAAQYYLSLSFLRQWREKHPYHALPEDFENDTPDMEKIRNEWETARRWAMDCTELGFKEGFYAQALCYDGTQLPTYYAKKHVDEYYRTYPIIRYEQVVPEKYDHGLALKAASRLGELYAERDDAELKNIDEMREELLGTFRFRCKEAEKLGTEEARLKAECALDNLRFYDEQRIAAAQRLLSEFPEQREALEEYIAFHERRLAEVSEH